jgi:hypothetical protein
MKRLYNFLLTLALALAATLSACLDEKDNQIVPDDHTMTTQADTLSFTIDGGTQTVAVTTDAEEWRAGYKFEEIPWFTFRKAADGKSVDVTVESNYTTDPREALLKITASELFKYIVIKQSSLTPYFTVDREQVDAYFRGETVIINVDTNVDYQISTESWVKAVKLDGGARLQLTILKNVVEEPRIANVKLFGSGAVINIFITQGPSEPLPFITTNGVWEVISYTSEERSGEGANGRAAQIIDGNLSTFWHSVWYSGFGAAGLPQEIVIDMKTRTEIEWIQVARRQPSNANTRAVEFQISDNQINWRPVGGITFTSAVPPGNALDTQLEGAIGRYLKVMVTESGSPPHVSIAEVVAKGYADPLPILDRTGWDIVSFTSQEEDGEPSGLGTAAAILDDDPATFWHSIWYSTTKYPRTLPQEIVVDMKALKTLTSVQIRNRNGGNDGLKDVEVWLGATNSTAAYQKYGTITFVSGERGKTKEVAVPDVSARYIKLVMPNSYDTQVTMAIAELYVWGTE